MFPDDPSAEQSGKSSPSAEGDIPTQPGLDGIPLVQLDEVLIAQEEAEQELENSSAPPAEAEDPEEPAVESSLPILPDRPEVAELKIDPDRFQQIEDYSLNVLAQESDPFFYTIYHAGRIPLERLENAGEENVAHAALRGAPDYYRGRVITIEGELRRLEEIPADQNAYGIEKFYNAWIITPTSDNIPYRVVARFKDESLPVSQLIRESVPVRVSGYFFKVQAYPIKGGNPQMTPVPWWPVASRKLPRDRFRFRCRKTATRDAGCL